jgi:starvation-inducible DNA-binding protein
MFDEQATEILATTDELAERVRKLGGSTLHSISEISKLQSIKDNNKVFVSANDMLVELMADTKTAIKAMRAAHEVADKHEDIATASILENFIDAAEKRHWFLFETSRSGDGSGH